MAAQTTVLRSSARRRVRKLWLPLVFLLPAILIWLSLIAVPMIDAILLSFQKWDGLRPATWVGFRNYINLFQDRIFGIALRNTAIFVVATVILQTTIPLLVANMVNSGIRGSMAYRTVFFMPVMISLAISGTLWSIIYEPNFGGSTRSCVGSGSSG